MPGDHEDRNVLFGVLALQADLLDAARLAEACAAWTAHKDTPLADLNVPWMKRDPSLDPLRQPPDFKQFLQELERGK